MAVVDGNVERVLQRLTGVALSAAQNWQQAQSLLTPSRAGDSNQALMELGAMGACRVSPTARRALSENGALREGNIRVRKDLPG